MSLETEIVNNKALNLYTSLGFVRTVRLFKYYLNGNDAFRLKLHFKPPTGRAATDDEVVLAE